MEKTADRAEPGFRTRLLILTALCAAFGAYAAAVPFDPAALRAVPAQEQAFAGEPVEFVLDVPYAAPSDVFVNVALLPDGVTFSSAQKSSYVSKDDPSVIGTRYRFWLTPRAAGTLALSPVRLIYRGEEYRVAAEPVQVYLNPALLEPELTIVFADSPCTDAAAAAEAGEPVRYTVAVRYAARVVSYSWGMPEDALFAETARYPFAGETGAEAPFSPDAQPLCEFSWTPLKAGASSLPPFTAEAVSYAGERMTLLLPEHRVQVNAPAAAAPENPGAETYFSQAFDEQYADDGAGAAGAEAVSAAQVRRIIEFRRAERNALPFSHARAERAAFEQEAGLAVGVREPSAALLRAALVACSVCLVCAAFCRVLHRAVSARILCVCALVCAAGAAYTGRELHRPAGVLLDGRLYSVPEYAAASVQTVPAGTRVRIVKETGGWRCIAHDGAEGWAPAAAVAVLNGGGERDEF